MNHHQRKEEKQLFDVVGVVVSQREREPLAILIYLRTKNKPHT